MEKIRVALLSYTIDGRRAKGTAVVARKCAEYLIERNDAYDVTLLHFEPSDDPIYSRGARDVVFPRFRWNILNKRSIRMLYYFLTTPERYDIMQWFQPRVYPFFFLAPTKHHVVFIHGAGDITEEKIKFILSRRIFNWTLMYLGRFISAMIGGSDYSRKDIIQRYGLDPKRVYVINNAVESAFSPQSRDAIDAAKKKYELPDRFFLDVARLIPHKNLMRTLRAYQLFRDLNPLSDLHFVNLGARGQIRPEVDRFLEQTKYADSIHLVPYVEQDDLPAVYSAAYALTFAVENEGFCLPAIESMASGTPAIISDTAAPDISGDEAYLVDALDEQSMADAMHAFAHDASLRERYREAGMKKAALLTWERTGGSLEELYRTVLKMNRESA